MKKMLFVGDLNTYGRSFQRLKYLKSLDLDILEVSSVPIPFIPGKNKSSFWERLFWKLSIPIDLTRVNKRIKNEIKKNNFDIVWIEKGNTIYPKTLKLIKSLNPEAKLVSCSEDDMYAPHNNSLYYRLGLKYYDLVFTTKTYNLEELKKYGAKKTELFLDAYDEDLHKPMALTSSEIEKFSSPVGFIGSFEQDRAEKIFFLAESGFTVSVWGSGWEGLINKHKNLIIKNEVLFEEKYAKAICATKINLCFLRKINRDEITSRSVEIPACGGFMLGERTKRHLDFFEEGKEAEFFSNNEELLNKVKFYLNNEEKRITVSLAGRQRCVSSGYSHKQQLARMLCKLGF